MVPRYTIGPVFCVRLAGVPFEVLDRLGAGALRPAAAALLDLERAIGDVRTGALGPAHRVPADHSGKEIDRAVRGRRPLTPEQLGAQPQLAAYDRAVRALPAARDALAQLIEREHDRLHRDIAALALTWLPDFLALQSDAAFDLLERLERTRDAAPARANSEDRKTSRSLAQYLQRVCAKNDTVSRFGPIAWGKMVAGTGLTIRVPADKSGKMIDARPGVRDRCVEAERWLVGMLADAIGEDEAVRDEAAPRLHPQATLEPDCYRCDEDRTIALTEAEQALARRCDGRTPAHALGDRAVLASLADRGVIVWRVELAGLDASPLATLTADVAAWRPSELRTTWLGRLAGFAELVRGFGAGTAAERHAVTRKMVAALGELGIQPRERGRKLYAATNPVSENCIRDATVTLGTDSTTGMLASAAPWLELYRDVFALSCDRAYARLAEVIQTAPRRAGKLSYAALCAHARTHEISIDRDQWLVEIATATFAEVKRDFRAQLATRPDAAEWQLTAEDCSIVRRRHAPHTFAELALPSADLQVMGSGDRLRWIIAELHHALAPSQHSFTWCCPDRPALDAMLTRAMAGAPLLVRDTFTEAPVHTGGEALLGLPAATYVANARPKPGWAVVRPADAEVVIDEADHDVRLRAPDGRDLGSILRTVRLITGGMHPFFPFEQAPHAPRLVLGDVILQRRAWTVSAEELGALGTPGASPELVVAIERARGVRGIPRRVYARPAPEVLASSDIFAKDKDMKPMFVDLESVVFLDVFARRLAKYGRFMLTEMLPAPEDFAWREPSGSYSFELRTVIESAR